MKLAETANPKGKCYGNFPGTTMMPAASDDLFPFDDDWRHIAMRAHIHHLCYSPVLRFRKKDVTWLLTLRILRISKDYA